MADPGDTLHFSADLYDKPPEDGGVLSNASAVALTITLPDGTAEPVTVVNPPVETGKYVYDYVTSTSGLLGRYEGQWVFTLSGGRTESNVEVFDVEVSMITVDEAINHLRAAGIITTADDLAQLQWLCLVATDAVERDLGRAMVARTVIERYTGGGSAIILRSTPVISITTVTEYGTPTTDYAVSDAGVLYAGTTSRRYFSGNVNGVQVTYRAGYTNPPYVARKVALNLVQAMWQGSQQAPHPALSDFNDVDVFSAQAALTPIEQAAYNSLRAASIA